MDNIQEQLFDSANRLFTDFCDGRTRRRAMSGEWVEELWTAVEDMGLPFAMVSESSGGADLTPVQALQLLKVAGRHALPLPLAETMIAAQLMDQAGLEPPGGPMTIMASPSIEGVCVVRKGDDWLLSGTVRRVPWARHARTLVLFAQDAGGVRLVAVAPSAGKLELGENLAGEPRDSLVFDNAKVSQSAPAALGSGERLFAYGAIARSSQIAGACDHTLSLTTDYANLRVQFGRPIGKFQVIQHYLATLATYSAAATASADGGIEEASRQFNLIDVATAKVRCGEAAGHAAAIAHQVFGAIGFTEEHSLHHTTRRLWSWRDEFGNERYWSSKLGRHLFEQGGSRLWLQMTETSSQLNKSATL